MRIKIDDLDRSTKENLFNQHAMFTDPNATEAAFYNKRVPVKVLKLSSVPEEYLYNTMTDEQCSGYTERCKDNNMLRIGVVANHKLIDGVHRITSGLRVGAESMFVADFSGLINTSEHMADHVCAIELLSDKEATPLLDTFMKQIREENRPTMRNNR
jgi:hypothetical protein